MFGEAALNTFLQYLFPLFCDPVIQKARDLWHVKDDMSELERELLHIQSFLQDAEEKQVTNSAVRAWMADLRDVVYDVDDLFDGIKTEYRLSIVEQQDESAYGKVLNFFSRKRRRGYGSVSDQVRTILGKLKRIEDIGNRYGLKMVVLPSLQSMEINPWRETSSLVDVSLFVGREEEKEKIISRLMQATDEITEYNYDVIPIVGMGGIGKTALAQLVYEDPRVQFDLKAWVCVSDHFNIMRVTKEIYYTVSNDTAKYGDMPLSSSQDMLRRALTRKRFFLVLDDVWTDRPSDWDKLRAPFAAGEKGSKIIITTRSTKVSTLWSPREHQCLGGLSEDHCWEIFKTSAFPTAKSSDDIPSDLEALGKQIVERCKGLPLAAKALGGMLRCTRSREKWRSVLKSELWDLPVDQQGIFSALRLSYHHLPSHLKPCFQYFSLYPCDYKYKKETLVKLWVSEGFVLPQGSRSLEDIGNEYFDELKWRSFLHPDENSGGYKMHDLMNALARDVSREFYLTMKGDGKSSPASHRLRHLSMCCKRREQEDALDRLPRPESLRTFLLHEAANYPSSQAIVDRLVMSFHGLRVLQLKNVTSVPKSMGHLKYLRYLSIRKSGIFMHKLPKSISGLCNLEVLDVSCSNFMFKLPKDLGKLRNLRHLNLAHTSIETLPDSVCSLSNLETLNLSGCYKFVELPGYIGELSSLRHLNLAQTQLAKIPDSARRLHDMHTLDLSSCDSLLKLPSWIGSLVNLEIVNISDCNRLPSLPSSIGQLTRLRIFGKFPVGATADSDAAKIGELKGMNMLEGFLEISGLQNVSDAAEARQAELHKKENLQRLTMEWAASSESGNVLLPAEIILTQTEVLEALQPSPKNLEYLMLENYGGWKLPKWMGDSSYSNLRCIELLGCRNCDFLPPLDSLPSLQVLRLFLLGSLKCIVGGTFGSLLELEVKNTSNLEALEGEFPVLKDLKLLDMLKLRYLSITAPGLKSLQVKECNELPSLPYLLSCDTLEVANCKKLSSWANGTLPTMIKKIKISECPNLTFPEQGFRHVTALQSLQVSGCRNLGKVLLPSTVKKLVLHEIDCLPSRLLLNLCTLETLAIRVTSQIDHLLEDGVLPATTLKHLKLAKIPAIPSVLLSRLISLEKLKISRCPTVEILPEEITFLGNLQTLEISGCDNLLSLPKGLNLLTSLRSLKMTRCPKLESFPEDGLPPNLRILQVEECPKLKVMYAEETSEGWPTVSHIPHLRFDDIDHSKCGMSFHGPIGEEIMGVEEMDKVLEETKTLRE